MLGIDLTKISRFKNPKKTFINKVLHKNEISFYNDSKNKKLFLASRWAIKEALFKANNKFFNFNKIEIKKENRVYKFPGYFISTTREGNYYYAIVMKENHESKN